MVAGLQVFTSLNMTRRRCEAREASKRVGGRHEVGELGELVKAGKEEKGEVEVGAKGEEEEHSHGERGMDIEWKGIDIIYAKAEDS